jgi:trehalose synthase-fused probable maltokinase
MTDIHIDLEDIARRLPEQRWFGGKGRAVARVELVDSVILDDAPPPLVLAIVTVHDEDGGSDLYHLALLVNEDGTSRDAFDEVDRLRCLGEMMAHGSSLHGRVGVFRFGGPGLDPLSPPGQVTARSMGAEQTNTSLVLDEEVIIKLLRRVDLGNNPELELTRLLTSEGFEHIPPHLGELIYEGTLDEEEVQVDLSVAQQFMRDSVEGWQEAIKRIHEIYDAVHDADVKEDLRYLTEERAAEILTAIEELGEVTASLHVVLAREELEPEIAPEPITEYDLSEWGGRAKRLLARLVKTDATGLAQHVGAIEARIDLLSEVSDAGLKFRAHSDFHLGQVLLTERGWMILDFEGEPARSLEERRAKQSPLRDVAGMMRSFNYAATAALFERAEPDSDAWRRLEPWAETWEQLARERYLHGYRARAHEGAFLPSSPDDLSVLLDVFEIDKALYELHYERGHRPEWIRIPLRGIERIATKGSRAPR